MNRTSNSTSRRGFTLIELLAAVAVLGLIVAYASQLLSGGMKIWSSGNKKSESNNAGRAAIEFVAREMGAALPSLGMALHSDADDHLGRASDRIAFAALSERPGTNTYLGSTYFQREVRQVLYKVLKFDHAGPDGSTIYALGCHNSRSPNTLDCYDNPKWADTYVDYSGANDKFSIIAENVRNFEIFVYDQSGAPVSNFKTSQNGQPFYADIYLEILAADDAVKVSMMGESIDYAQRNTHRYHARVYFTNKRGYEIDT